MHSVNYDKFDAHFSHMFGLRSKAEYREYTLMSKPCGAGYLRLKLHDMKLDISVCLDWQLIAIAYWFSDDEFADSVIDVIARELIDNCCD